MLPMAKCADSRSFKLSPFCLFISGWLVHDCSGSLQQGTADRTQSPAALLELVYGRHCAIVSIFLVLCVLFTTFSLASYITQMHRRSASLFIGPSPLSLLAAVVCAQRARSQSRPSSDKAPPMKWALPFTWWWIPPIRSQRVIGFWPLYPMVVGGIEFWGVHIINILSKVLRYWSCISR